MSFCEVCNRSKGVRLDSWYLVFQSGDKFRHDLGMESFLEFVRHVVSDLSNAVEGGISDLGVGVFQVLKKDRDHATNFGGIVNVLTHLGEGHDASMLITPVRIVCNGVRDQLSNEGQHNLVTNASH